MMKAMPAAPDSGPTLPWFCREDWMVFTWDLWYSCNYRCRYCWWEIDDRWEEDAKKNRILAPEAWGRLWDRMHALYGPVLINMVGGEPLLYPRVDELIERLCGKHHLRVTTNLSLPIARLSALLARVSPQRLHIAASCHPETTEQGRFLEKLELLRDKGFAPIVAMVTFPPLLDRVAELKDDFDRRGFPLCLAAFQGRWEDKEYPRDYTDEQRRKIAALGGGLEGAQAYRVQGASPRGKLCHSGRLYANIKADGTAYRCGHGGPDAVVMGDFFKDDFRLHDEPKPCPFDTCNCNEFRYLDEIRGKPGPAHP